MFEDLTSKLEGVFKKLRGQGKLTEKNIQEGLREVRRALLEADVNYKVTKDFINRVTEKSLGKEVINSITPGQLIIKIVYDELVSLMGHNAKDINFAPNPPTKIMLVGLQGSGKTTACGKLANYIIKKKNKKVLLVACDIYRPAAIKQLEVVGKSLNVDVYSEYDQKDVLKIAKNAMALQKEKEYDVLIFDTAGRLHIDEEMMTEVANLKSFLNPEEILFVADGMTGQDAVNVAKEFNDKLDATGIILTKMDGDARGGAALSILEVTGKPIKFIGTGEKFDALDLFHPDRMASRILGMGDIVSFVEKAQMNIDAEKAAKMEERLRNAEFTFDDFIEQLQQIKKMGPLDQLLGMLPGMSKLKGVKVEDKALSRIEAIISSMTPQERARPEIIDGSRRKRISKGSGTTIQEVNQLLNQFMQMRKMMKKFNKMNFSKISKIFPF